MLFPDFRKRAENRLSHGGSIQSAALRKENDNSNLGLLRWCIANEETMRLLRVAGDGRARLPGDVHAAHISCMHLAGKTGTSPSPNTRPEEHTSELPSPLNL